MPIPEAAAAATAATAAATIVPWWASGAFAIAGSLVVALLTLAGARWLRRDEHNHTAADTKAEVVVALLAFMARQRHVDKALVRIERTYKDLAQQAVAIRQRLDTGTATTKDRQSVESGEQRLRTVLSQLEDIQEQHDQLNQEWSTHHFQAYLYLSKPIVDAFGAMHDDGRDHWTAIQASIIAWGRREVDATRAGGRTFERFLGEANREPAWKVPKAPEQKA